MIINYYYKQHITHQQYKSGVCVYIYIYIYLPNEKVSIYILARSNKKKKSFEHYNKQTITHYK